jgi:vancomycin resistance protein YoaR
MRKFLRIAVLVVAVPISLALMVGVVFGIDRATNAGEVLGEVRAGEVDLGGLGEPDARAALRRFEHELAGRPVTALVAGHTFRLYPRTVGFDIDEEAMLAVAMEHGRTGGLDDQFEWWVQSFDEQRLVLDLPYSYDEAAILETLADWELEGIDTPPTTGDVTIAGGEVIVEYPEAGTGIAREEAAALLGAALIDLDRTPIEIPARPLDPPLQDSDLDAVAAGAERLLVDQVTLIGNRPGDALVIPRPILAEALSITRDDGQWPPTFGLAWDPEPLQEYAAPLSPYLTSEPRDADLIIDDVLDEVTLVPGIPALEPDPDALLDQVLLAVGSVTRAADLVYRAGEDPDVTTEELAALGIKEKIGEFTTYHNCCENRVINIQLIADAVDGAMVMPGETWSLNDHVGQRTREKGYVPAGAIIKGEVSCCDSPINIGGGTSQFTTTLYNAIFFAALEDVYHQPHTIYFTRYPEGREATLGFPAPDLVFRNNTDSALVIRTSHTDTSITAKIFGDNGGLEVEAGLSDRYNYSGIVTRREANPDVAPFTERIKSAGSGGWSVDIYRYITHPDGTETTEEWTWHYSGGYRIIEVHPCMLKSNPQKNCPTD